MTSQITSRYSADEATTELWNLAVTDDITRLEHLVACGADVNAPNEDGVTALMRASASGRLAMAMALIGYGAEINAQRVDGFTPLMLASFFGHADVVKALVQHGADPAITNRFGTSAEMWATTRSFHEIAEYLQAALEAPAETPLPHIPEEVSHVPEEDAWTTALYSQNTSDTTSFDFEAECEVETKSLGYADAERTAEDNAIAEEPIVSKELFMAEEIVVPKQRLIEEDSFVGEAEVEYVSAMSASQRLTIDESAFAEEAEEPNSIPGSHLPMAQRLIIDESAFDEPGVAESTSDERNLRKPVSRGLIIDESAFDEINDESHSAQQVSPAPVPRGLIIDDSAYDESVVAEPSTEELPSPKAISRGLIVDESAYDDFEEPAVEEHVVQAPVSRRLIVDDSALDEPIVDQPNSGQRSSRLLTDPPEIWDMVHESEVEFRPGFAFVTRITSGWTNIALLLLLIALVTGGGTFALLKFRNGGFQSLSSVTETKKPQTSAIPKAKPAEPKKEVVTPVPQPTAAPVESVSPTVPPFAATANATVESASAKPPTAKPSVPPRVNTAVVESQPASKTPVLNPEPVVRETTTIPSPSGARTAVQKEKVTPKSSPVREEREVARDVPTVKPQVESRDTEPAGAKVASTKTEAPRVSEPPPNNPPAPKPAAQPKAKVIQWP